MDKLSQVLRNGSGKARADKQVSDPNMLRITEKWDSLEDLMAHFQEPHMAEFQKVLAEHPPKGMQASFYEAEEFTPPGF